MSADQKQEPALTPEQLRALKLYPVRVMLLVDGEMKTVALMGIDLASLPGEKPEPGGDTRPTTQPASHQ